MSFAVAGLHCGMTIEDTECILTSFPNFAEILSTLRV
jgi:3-phosphoshikimate 1-carboxyvinyltransferase